MQISYKKVSEEDVPMYEKAMVNALGYMKYKYPDLCYCGLKVELHSCDGGSYFYGNKNKGFRLKIHNRFKLYLYGRKSCGLTTPRGGIEVPAYVDAVITIIHELTHYAQAVYGETIGNKPLSYKFGTFTEIDTTKNSIEYLKVFHPDVHAKLIKTETDYPVPTHLEKLFSKINTDEIIKSVTPVTDSDILKEEEMKTINSTNTETKEYEILKQEEAKLIKPSAPMLCFSSVKEAKEVTKQVRKVVNDFVKADRDKENLENLLAKKKCWESKQKRAENAIKKLNKKIKYYQKKLKK